MLHGSRSRSPENHLPRQPTHIEEQEELRKETIAAFHNAISEGEDDDFLVLREKIKDELEMEEEDYRAFLEREVGDLRELVELDGDAQPAPQACQEEGKKGSRGCEWPMPGLN